MLTSAKYNINILSLYNRKKTQTRLAESVDGLDSSLNQSPGEL